MQHTAGNVEGFEVTGQIRTNLSHVNGLGQFVRVLGGELHPVFVCQIENGFQAQGTVQVAVQISLGKAFEQSFRDFNLCGV